MKNKIDKIRIIQRFKVAGVFSVVHTDGVVTICRQYYQMGDIPVILADFRRFGGKSRGNISFGYLLRVFRN